MLKICEVFKSIQGESSCSGRICSFVRLAGCNLRCRWCDTAYAWEGGTDRTAGSIVSEAKAHGTSLVEITGGEPLLQPETPLLCEMFIEAGYTVLVETNGSIDISPVPPRVIRIVDIKTPSSGHENSFLDENYRALRLIDECKFVISDRIDFDWSMDIVRKKNLNTIVSNVIFSPVVKACVPDQLAEWIIEEKAPVRLGIQLHKIIWGDKRGV
jgi:7-carboxy-7-deazaguanine synthase